MPTDHVFERRHELGAVFGGRQMRQIEGLPHLNQLLMRGSRADLLRAARESKTL